MYREERRGHWFGGGTAVLFVNDSTYDQKKETEFYIANEQEGHLIRIRDEQQIELLYNCMYGPLVKPDEIAWLIDPEKGRFKYFDSVQDYIDSRN